VLAELRKEVAAKDAALAELTARRTALAQRADALNPHSLDPDMVDERVRAVLGYARDGDLVLPRDELERMLKEAESAS
jgi:cell division protein FtsB